MADENVTDFDVERLQAEIAAWGFVSSGLEAYLQDRINNCDPPSWEKALSVLRGDVGDKERRSRQIYAASQARTRRAEERAEAAADEIERLRRGLYAIIELDHHNMGPESRATALARAALNEEDLAEAFADDGAGEDPFMDQTEDRR